MRKLISLFLSVIITVGIFLSFANEKVFASGEEEYWRSYSSTYAYDHLSDIQKKVYDAMDKAFMECLLDEDNKYSYVDVSIFSLNILETSENGTMIKEVYDLLKNSNPQYFFFGSTNTLYKRNKINITTKTGTPYYSIFRIYLFSDFENGADRARAKEEVKAAVEGYAALVKPEMFPEEKEKVIHDSMCKNMVYGDYYLPSGTMTNQTIYSAIKNLTVCNGYACLFEAVMNRIGIECAFTAGDHHAWNVIHLHGNWYYVDVTSDDNAKGTLYKFYNCNTVAFDNGNGYKTYKPLKIYGTVTPTVTYDVLNEGRNLIYYSPRYFSSGDNVYFVVNDSDENGGRKALLVKGNSASTGSSVSYNGKTYSVVIDGNEAPADGIRYVSTSSDFSDFVERLYVLALGRASEKEGKEYWCEQVGNGNLTGGDCARFFLCSPEFKNRGLNRSQFVDILYWTFFNRDPEEDMDGFYFWYNSLDTMYAEDVINGFINSTEWCNVCASYGVKSGAQYAKATVASANSVSFATRLYTECLGRQPEESGLNYWSLGLTNLELTGSQAAHEFFYSEEFLGFGLGNEEYIRRLYKTFMGREPEEDGFNYWVGELSNGKSRDEVFAFFSSCPEFTDICNSYAISR